MNIGAQYEADDQFKALARLHQSRYRAEVLKVEYNQYGNRLTDHDAQALLNYYDKLNCEESLRNRYPSYSRKRDADMLRSEHIPFNLLSPLATNKDAALSIISKAWGIECTEIDIIKIEYAPSPKQNYLNDGTAFDTYIQVQMPDGKTCGIGIEVKYTEQSYPIGKTEALNVENHDSPYWSIARASGCFKDPENEIFGTDAFRQIWRNHLLGLAMVERCDLDHFYSITLFPEGNEHFRTTIPLYVSHLADHARSHVFGCTFEKYISAIGDSAELLKWKEWLERRYIV